MFRLKVLFAVAVFVILAVVFSGCVGIKPGSYSLSQPAGIGPLTMKFSLCTYAEAKAEEGTSCGPVPAGEGTQAQIMAGLIVPSGTPTPESFAATPAPGSLPITFTRNAEVTAQMSANVIDFPHETTGVPAGFELAGYVSPTINEVEGQGLEWSAEPSIGLPPTADGGSYGGPLKAILVSGWRNVKEPELPASRPINCSEPAESGGETLCGAFTTESEATLGTSDLKLVPPAPATAVPGQQAKLPFVLDFASSAAAPPAFALTAATNLPGVAVGLSNASFERAPSDPVTHRAPPTTRKAIVAVPKDAPLGSYEVTFTATAAQGGAVSTAATLQVQPKGPGKVFLPKRLKARVAYRRGVPVKLYAPIAGSRFRLLLKGPRARGKGLVKLRKRVSGAKQLGSSKLRLKLPRKRVEALLAAGKPLRLVATVRVPGRAKPQHIVRRLKLR